MQETLEKTRAMVHHLAAVNEILEKNGNDPSRLIPILQEVQEDIRFLPPTPSARTVSNASGAAP